MTREQAQLILKHIDIVKHFANGGQLDHVSHDWKGDPTPPTPVEKGIIINCLPMYQKSNRPNFNTEMKHYCSRWCPLKKRHKDEGFNCAATCTGGVRTRRP